MFPSFLEVCHCGEGSVCRPLQFKRGFYVRSIYCKLRSGKEVAMLQGETVLSKNR